MIVKFVFKHEQAPKVGHRVEVVATKNFTCIPYFKKGMPVIINGIHYYVGNDIWVDADECVYYVQIARKLKL